jgi:hypothetical protein
MIVGIGLGIENVGRILVSTGDEDLAVQASGDLGRIGGLEGLALSIVRLFTSG